MRDRLDQFGDAAIAVVTFAAPGDLVAYRQRLEIPFPLLADEEREVYGRFELGRGSVRNIWSPGTLRLYAKLLRRGRRMRLPQQDTRQLGGDFVLDGSGRLAAGFWPPSPDSRPAVTDLIEAVASVR